LQHGRINSAQYQKILEGKLPLSAAEREMRAQEALRKRAITPEQYREVLAGRLSLAIATRLEEALQQGKITHKHYQRVLEGKTTWHPQRKKCRLHRL
jgi:hypothetical protein